MKTNIELDNVVNKVIRDKNGFASELCLDEIGNSLPVLLIYKGIYTLEAYKVVDGVDYDFFRGEIDRNTRFINWIRINVTE